MKRNHILLIIPITIFFLLFLIPWSAKASNDGNKPFLGDCIDYGIVSNELYLNSDIESNFATGKYSGKTDIGNTVSSNKANAAGNILIGEVLEDGKWNNVRNNTPIIVASHIKEKVETMIGRVEKYSKSVIDNHNDSVLPTTYEQNSYIINISEEKDNVVYANIDFALGENLQNGALKIIMRANQTIVLNSTERNEITINRYSVSIVDGTKTNEELAKSVIWNMPYVNALRLQADHIRATIIAPNAYTYIGATAEGWLVCNVVTGNSGEWHMIYQGLDDYSPVPQSTKKPMNTSLLTDKPDDTTPIPTIHQTIMPTLEPTVTAVATNISTPTPIQTNKTTNIPILVTESTPTPSNTPVIILDNDSPLSDKKIKDTEPPNSIKKKKNSSNNTTILNEEVPLSDSIPNTGDTSDIVAVILIFILALFFIIEIIRMKK